MDQYIGRLLDNRYEILEIIGTGGMAVVYKARCHRLNRLVAIKILKDEFARDEEFRRRFHAEGEAVAMLSHPNIVQVYDVSSTDSANFIVMELVSGISLRQYMEKKGVLNWKETLHFAMQIAKGLEHAHSRGIVHRDIKPHNVMVLKNGSVKVMDFGIARVMSKSNTLTKEALGSVHYISPEQAKGGYTDNRSDLYSLSVVMYEMMTGRPPYDGESPVAVAIQHINGGAAMPSTLNPNIPGGLEQIIMHGMELETKDRYTSATEMLRDMDEFRKDPGVLFPYNTAGVVSAATQPLNIAGVKAAMTTAERVAGRRTERNAETAKITLTEDGRLQSASNTGRNRTASGTAAAAGTRRISEMSTSSDSRRISEKAAAQRRRQREIEEEERRSRITTVAIVVCSLVAVAAIIIFLIALFSGALFSHSVNLVDVPKLEGEMYKELSYFEDFTIVTGQPEYHEEIEKGRIIRQEPTPGSRVEKGAKITVILSLGQKTETIYMEELRGSDIDVALRFLEGQGMNPLPFEEFSDEYAEGEVIRTNPVAGTPLTEGQKVEVYYSSGPVIVKEKMPDVVGLNFATAMKRLDDLGFDNVDVERVESEEPKDTVIAQSVPKYTETDTTEKIVLTISKGPGVKKAVVPNVVVENLTLKEAIKILNELGFTNIVEEYVESDKPENVVLYQSVSQGTEIDVNTKIILRVSLGPTETRPPRDENITRRVKIPVPDLGKTYFVEIWQGGNQIREAVKVESGVTEIEVELTGSGVQVYELYYSTGEKLPEPYDTFEVNFG